MDSLTISLGAISLYPAAGQLETLRGFFPPGLRSWFAVISTIFSTLVWYWVQIHFEFAQSLCPLWLAALAAPVLLALYIFLHMCLKRKYAKLSGWRHGIVVVGLVVIYSGMTTSLTYSFNFLDRLRDHRVVKLKIEHGGSGSPAAGAEVRLRFKGNDDIVKFTNSAGRATAVIRKDRFQEKFTGITVSLRTNGSETHYLSKLRGEVDVNARVLRLSIWPKGKRE